ncbi:hypothetical protein BHU16_04260 [Tannerella sp. oral taxon 808]|nr:hypothetical protein BHU16_04260 [Tannerella sp. oral taxon 808]
MFVFKGFEAGSLNLFLVVCFRETGGLNLFREGCSRGAGGLKGRWMIAQGRAMPKAERPLGMRCPSDPLLPRKPPSTLLGAGWMEAFEGRFFASPEPRALPWAIIQRPFRPPDISNLCNLLLIDFNLFRMGYFRGVGGLNLFLVGCFRGTGGLNPFRVVCFRGAGGFNPFWISYFRGAGGLNSFWIGCYWRAGGLRKNRFRVIRECLSKSFEILSIRQEGIVHS